MSPLKELMTLLRPAGGGLFAVSTGLASQRALQQLLYDAATEDDVRMRWRAALERLPTAKVVLLGVPTDVGAGYQRGASFGPQEIRRTLLHQGAVAYRDPAVVDAGDVFSVPQLLHDDMLSGEQLTASRRALYGDGESELPVSPLSITERALDLIRALAPQARPLLLGGDHAVGWPGFLSTARGREDHIGVLHFDAHTDLLAERLGIRYCFATWAFHANALMGRPGRLQQVGIRISGRPREHWESTLGVRQFWMNEVRERGAEAIADEIVDNLRASGAQGVYISNDIDGTDPKFAAATGTPEPGGLSPDEVELIARRVAKALPVWGSDVVEVAPPLAGHIHGEPAQTLRTAARYVELQTKLSLAG